MEEKYLGLWVKIKYMLQQTIGEKTFNEYFEPINKIAKVENNTIFMLTPNNFIKNRIDKLFLNKINEYSSRESNISLRFKFITNDEIVKVETERINTEIINNMETIRNGNLNQTYTFENFVTGRNNRLASTIAIQVADQPGVFANPLYIFGDVGLGKTHLMQSIGNYIIDNNHTKTVLYVKTENFVEDYVNLLRSKQIEKFNEKYKDIDVLLVDDIQFLSKKNQSQQEFFKLFEKLHAQNKQIVITSDRPTTELKDIMTRLTSRFSWGLVADINAPDLEHRIEILKKKLTTHSIQGDDIPLEVLELIAKNFTSSVRELEGALNRVIFYKTMLNEDLTVDNTLEALKPLLKNKELNKNLNKTSDVDKLFDIVCGYYNISRTDVISNSRKRSIVYPRQVIMYLMRKIYEIPFKKIGSFFNGKDHSTVINSCEKITFGIKNEDNIKKDIENLESKIK
ncbi:chromosomal replication initiator protein DnaA [Mycoplasmatota bacterium]|nr:chromosomal replication initiator protein DnaA [Mycoplasmatota bacterium]